MIINYGICGATTTDFNAVSVYDFKRTITQLLLDLKNVYQILLIGGLNQIIALLRSLLLLFFVLTWLHFKFRR